MDKWGFTSAKFCEAFLKKGEIAELQFCSFKFQCRLMRWRWHDFEMRLTRILRNNKLNDKHEPSDVRELPELRPGGSGPRPAPPSQELLRRRRQSSQKRQRDFSEVQDQTSQKATPKFSEVRNDDGRQFWGPTTKLLRTPRQCSENSRREVLRRDHGRN